MTDILVKLYELPELPPEIAGIEMRRPLPHERETVRKWIASHFYPEWGAEFEGAFKSFPVTAFIALRENALVGFACYEVTLRGFFGPAGVLESERGRGLGRQLLLRSMAGLRELGYAYGIVGAAGPVEFYVDTLGGIPIPGSSPGIYPRGKIRADVE